jgi:hypothetical protein
VGIKQRVSLRKFTDDIRRWVEEDRSDEWIASALGTSPSSVQSFRSRNAIYRRPRTSTLHDPKDYSSYEGVLEPEGPGVWFDPEIGRPPLAEALEQHREGRAAPHTDQDRLPEAWGRQGPGGDPLASASARPGLRRPTHSGEACHGGCVNPCPSISFGTRKGNLVEAERPVLERRGAHASSSR